MSHTDASRFCRTTDRARPAVLVACALWSCMLLYMLGGPWERLERAAISLYRQLEAKGDASGSTCTPNENLHELRCENTTVYHAMVGSDPLTVHLDLDQDFDASTSSFSTEVSLWFNFREFVQQPWVQFSFNSSTPSPSWLNSGTTPIGTFQTAMLNASFPAILMSVNVLHNFTIMRDDICSDFPELDVYCDSGWFTATVGLQGWGFTDSHPHLNVTAKLSDPAAVQIRAPFRFYVDKASYCIVLDEYIHHNQALGITYEFCSKTNASAPCTTQVQRLNTTGLDGLKHLGSTAC